MNWLFQKVESLASKMDGLTMHNQLENPQHPEVAEFMRNYHLLAFEIARYRRTGANQTMEVEVCKSIVERVNMMNEFLLFYQSSEDTTLFHVVSIMREHYHMDTLLQLRNEIEQKNMAEQQRQQAAGISYSFPSPPYYANTTNNGLSMTDVHMIPTSNGFQ